MTPGEVWDALKDKGVNPENIGKGAYNSRNDIQPLKKQTEMLKKLIQNCRRRNTLNYVAQYELNLQIKYLYAAICFTAIIITALSMTESRKK